MERSSLLRFLLPLVGLLTAIGTLQVTDSTYRRAVGTDPAVSEGCRYETRGFPLTITEQTVPLGEWACPDAQTLTATNMLFNWIFYSTVLVLASILIRPPAWMRQNNAAKLAGYSASLIGLSLTGVFGWGLS